MAKSVVLFESSRHVGGLTSGGLGFVNLGNVATIGGLAREYFYRVWKFCQDDSAWKTENRHLLQGQHEKLLPGEETFWLVELSVAERLFEQMLAEQKMTVVRGERLNRRSGVTKDDSGVRTHLRQIYELLHVRSRTEAVARFIADREHDVAAKHPVR